MPNQGGRRSRCEPFEAAIDVKTKADRRLRALRGLETTMPEFPTMALLTRYRGIGKDVLTAGRAVKTAVFSYFLSHFFQFSP